MKYFYIFLVLFLIACGSTPRRSTTPAPESSEPHSCSELYCEYVQMAMYCQNPNTRWRDSQKQYACAFRDEYRARCPSARK